jgi:glucokinase
MIRLLAGDIGGTKTLLAVVEGGKVLAQRRFESGKYPGLAPIVKEFLATEGAGAPIVAACLAVAGPVAGGESVTPNLPWIIRARELVDTVGTPRVELVNDFAAVGWGIPMLGPADLATLQAGEPQPGGAIAYIGAGTGCGQGFMVHVGGAYHVMPSEGGHGDYAATDEVEFGVLRHLQKQHGHVSYERVLSGAGLVNIYRALVNELGRPEASAVRAEMEKEDPAAVVSRRGLEGTDPTCVAALDRFVHIYGAEAGNHALRVLATGGVFIAGGIAPRILEKIKSGTFLQSFNGKGRLAPLCRKLPVHVIVNPSVGLLGAAACAARVATRKDHS